MKRLIITENEKNRIKKLYLNEESESNPLSQMMLTALERLKKLQSGEIKLDDEETDEMSDDELKKELDKLSDKKENEKFISPIESFVVTSKFGVKRKGIDKSTKPHPGTDLRSPSGSKLKAIEDGVVIDAEIRDNSCGGTLYIDHQNGFKSRFCHLKDIKVKKGDKVIKGQVVGLTGGGTNDIGRGLSTGAHLHFELYKDGTLIDPEKYIN